MGVYQLKAQLEALGECGSSFTVVGGELLVSAGRWLSEEGNVVDYAPDLMIRVWPGQELHIELVWSYPYQLDEGHHGKAHFTSVDALHTFIFEL